MLFRLRLCVGLLCGVVAVTMLATPQSASAEDLTHMVSGVVKHVDKDTKTMVVKTKDGTEHTIKYTDKTAIEGAEKAATPRESLFRTGKSSLGRVGGTVPDDGNRGVVSGSSGERDCWNAVGRFQLDGVLCFHPAWNRCRHRGWM
jgi:hypothetical protein